MDIITTIITTMKTTKAWPRLQYNMIRAQKMNHVAAQVLEMIHYVVMNAGQNT